MYCNNCGNQVNEGDMVCSRCGKRLASATSGSTFYGRFEKEKSVIGLSLGTLAAITYMMGIVGGYIALFLITGYIVFFEKNNWLKKNALNAILISLFFSTVHLVIGFVPDVIGLLTKFVVIFNGSLSIPVLTQICTFCTSLVSFVGDIVLLICAYLATKGIEMRISFIERMF